MIDLPTEADPVKVVCGDALEVLRALPDGCVDAVITDPPWGIDADVDYSRFVNGAGSRDFGSGIAGDAEPFDPAPWLRFPRVALWGANCFAQRLPVGRWLVWVKKRDSKLGTFMSDAEVCWVNHPTTKRRAPGVYVKRYIWDGFDREGERGKSLHPTQKPVEVMKWTIEMAEVPPGALVLDPYGGSGPTAVACLHTGHRCLIVEQDPAYCDVIRRRVADAQGVGKGSLLAPPADLFAETA